MILVIIHEWGHFILARKFGVRVDEFGVGFPPRLFGKKVGETLYSFNLLPFGAFVKIRGEDGDEPGFDSFSQKPIWQRSLIILGGVITFWITAAILFAIVMSLGANIAIDDNDTGFDNPRVQITAIAVNSPANTAGLAIGDSIKSIKVIDSTDPAIGQEFRIDRVVQVQEITEEHQGKQLAMTIERGQELLNVEIVPRVNPPKNEGPVGIVLMRTAIKIYPWYEAIWQGIVTTGRMTVAIAIGWYQALIGALHGQPSGAQVMGPIGIFSTFVQISKLGAVYFIQFIALISVHLALFNILPIPVVDGGRLLFLVIEGLRRRPMNKILEQRINLAFFSLLIFLMVWVTVKDVIRLF